MSGIPVYTRDESGQITYRGIEHWDSTEQMLEYYGRQDMQPETEQLIGWPHDRADWYGDTGIGRDSV